LGGGAKAFKGGLRGIIYFLDAGSDALLTDQFDGREEKIIKQSQLISVQVVHGLQGLVGVVAHIAKQLSDMGPVLLFYMGIVILLIWATAGEDDAR